MALTTGIDVARSSLAVTSEQISVASRNIARVNDSDATRKNARVTTGPGSNVHITRVDRSYDAVLLQSYLNANASNQQQGAISTALDRLQSVVDDTDLERSPAALISKLNSALQSYSAAPDNPAVAATVISAAKDLSNALNDASSTIASVRQQADTDIASSVDRINNELSQFADLNKQVVQGTQRGTDVTDALDARDAILKKLSSELGIRTIERADGDVAIYTDSGVTLFDKSPRAVTFNASPLLGAGDLGSPVYADGVPIAGTPHVMAIGSGALAGLVAVRDQIAPTFETQIDEIARGLISAFAETDQSATPTLPPAAGLFTWSGGPGIPASGTAIAGLAGSIKINASVDPTQGGDVNLVRDGGIAGAAYSYNSSGGASYTDRIQQLIGTMDTTQTFDAGGQLAPNSSVSTFAKASISWLEALRQSSSGEADYRKTVADRSQQALSKQTGISLDEEMTNLLDLERTYQASARLISTVDSMMQTLLQSLA